MVNRITTDDVIVIAGGGGFIGGWLVRHLLERGFKRVRSIDLKPLDEWYQVFPEAENIVADLRKESTCQSACRGAMIHVPGVKSPGRARLPS